MGDVSCFRYGLRCSAVCVLLVVVFATRASAVPDVSEDTEVMVSRGTTIHVIEDWKERVRTPGDLRALPMQWLPIGTKVVRFPRTEEVVFIRKRRRIVKAISEFGVRGYVVRGDDNFFGEGTKFHKNVVAQFAKEFETVAFVRESVKAVVRDRDECQVQLYSGTYYKFVDEMSSEESADNGGVVLMELGKRHRNFLCRGVRLAAQHLIQVPSSKVRVADFSAELKAINFYPQHVPRLVGGSPEIRKSKQIVEKLANRYWRSGIIWSPSITKDCQSELQLTEDIKKHWEASFALMLGFKNDWFSASSGLAAEIKSTRNRLATTHYGIGVEVLQFHGVNLGKSQIHVLEFWSAQGCPNPSDHHSDKFASYRLPGQVSVPLPPSFFEEAGFQVHTASFRVQLLCHSQYVALKGILTRVLGDNALPYLDSILAKVSRVKFANKDSKCSGGLLREVW